MLAILTSIIGIVAKGRAAKAIAGGVGGVILTAAGPAFDMLQKGFVDGLAPSFEQLGSTLGMAVGGFIVSYAITWLAPKNTPA